MKEIGILEFKEKVNERLNNPDLFADQTLVLWNANYAQNSIAYSAIMECCVEYNLAHADQQKWLTYSDETFTTDDYTNPQVFCFRKDMRGYKDSGILFNTGCFLLEEKQTWLKFVNTHQNTKGGISANWPLIVCAQANEKGITEEDFSDNCEICKLQ